MELDYDVQWYETEFAELSTESTRTPPLSMEETDQEPGSGTEIVPDHMLEMFDADDLGGEGGES